MLCCFSVSSLQPDSSHYFGFAYFRQVKDADIKRGYFQKVSWRKYRLEGELVEGGKHGAKEQVGMGVERPVRPVGL